MSVDFLDALNYCAPFMSISVVLSTYNSPKWLEKVLWGYSCQSHKDFEVVIADDGSGEETFDVIARLKKETALRIQHVWHEDNGFQKCLILNKAIVASKGDYLIFSDGDCIPRADFVEQHFMRRKQGYFLSGGYSKLNMDASHTIGKDEILSGKAFDVDYLDSLGLKKKWNAKHCAQGIHAQLMNWVTPTLPTWNGHNASTWKDDILKTNGFDERMVYGGQDREFGERLFNLGLKSVQIRYSAVCIHLDHKRGYVTQEGIEFNKSLRKSTKKSGVFWTEYGIKQSDTAKD